MIIIETTGVILPRFKRRNDVTDFAGGVSNYTCFAALGVVVTIVGDAKLFRQAVRRYAQDDWSEHKQVRLAAKKARSKARAQQRKWVAEDLERWETLFEKEREARMKADDLASERYKIIQAMKLTFNELKGGE